MTQHVTKEMTDFMSQLSITKLHFRKKKNYLRYLFWTN